ARHDPVYEDVATKFFEHFAYIASALDDMALWDDAESFFYDRLVAPDGTQTVMKVRSIGGLVPLVASAVFDPRHVRRAAGFSKRAEWFVERRQGGHDWLGTLTGGPGERGILAVLSPERLARVLAFVFDPERFLSPHGIRSLSRWHLDHPFTLELDGATATIAYEPAESRAAIYGGNSNWRGPVWFPLNVLVLESLLRYRVALGDALRIGSLSDGSRTDAPASDSAATDAAQAEPSGSDAALAGSTPSSAPSADHALADLRERLISLFLRGPDGRRPADGEVERYRSDPEWRDQVTFYEYFDGDTGRGLGASHQTGWTGLVAHLILERPVPTGAKPAHGEAAESSGAGAGPPIRPAG
ncbi:MAG TPA: hypothetical protein VEY67_12155, partial [Candidatus Dormibacteraeota bacterium]|nr:hypothetical protein [Candidatus Dormibacteraeota bacterium]